MNTPTCVSGRVLLLLVILISSASGVSGQETIRTEFSFGNATVYNVLPEAAKAAVASRVAMIMADSGQSAYPFIQWRPLLPNDGAPTGLRLTLRMAQTVQPISGNQKCYRIDLVYDPPRHQESLYPMCSFFSPQDTSGLITKLHETIVRSFSNPSFRAKLDSTLVQRISLADDIIVDERQGIVVPVSFDVLLPARGSVLGVEFLARDENFGNQERGGEIDLRNPQNRELACRSPNTTKWMLEKMEILPPPETCLDDFPCLLERWKSLEVDSVKVFIKSYSRGDPCPTFDDIPSESNSRGGSS